MSSVPKPIDAPSSDHRSSSVSWSISIFAVRVASVTWAAAAGPDRPLRSSSSSISLRRFEKWVSTRCGDAGDVGDVVVDRAPSDAEPAGELVTQRGLEHDAGGELRPVQRLPVERGPAPVRARA